MSTRWNPIGVVALTLAVAPTAAFAAGAAAPTFTKDIAPIFQEKCEACHRPDSIAPMSLVTYEEARPWARSIKTPRRGAPDAAVAHRQDGRHPGVQERSLAERRADRHDRHAGSTPARRRATRRTCRPPMKWPNEQGWNFAKLFGQTEPDLDHHVDAVDAEGRRERRVVEARSSTTGLTEPRWVRAIEIRPGTVKGRKITHHAIARLSAGRDRSARAESDDDPTRQRRRPARSWNGPSASRAK